MKDNASLILGVFLTVTIVLILTIKGVFWEVAFDFSKQAEQLSSSLEINTTLFLLLILLGIILVFGSLFYGLLLFEQRGLPSNRVLRKIGKDMGDSPFTLEKINGKWVANKVDENIEDHDIKK